MQQQSSEISRRIADTISLIAAARTLANRAGDNATGDGLEQLLAVEQILGLIAENLEKVRGEMATEYASEAAG